MSKSIKAELVSAKAKHYLFKAKLRNFLEGSTETDENALTNHNLCALGIWIKDVGIPNFYPLKEIEELNLIHQKIHEVATKLVGLKKEGFEKKALEGMVEITNVGNIIVAKIDQLYAVIADHPEV